MNLEEAQLMMKWEADLMILIDDFSSTITSTTTSSHLTYQGLMYAAEKIAILHAPECHWEKPCGMMNACQWCRAREGS